MSLVHSKPLPHSEEGTRIVKTHFSFGRGTMTRKVERQLRSTRCRLRCADSTPTDTRVLQGNGLQGVPGGRPSNT